MSASFNVTSCYSEVEKEKSSNAEDNGPTSLAVEVRDVAAVRLTKSIQHGNLAKNSEL